MDRGTWWATVHAVAKSKDTTEHLTLSYVNYRSIMLEREREKEKPPAWGKKKINRGAFFCSLQVSSQRKDSF